MQTQTQMLNMGASPLEAKNAMNLFKLLKPGLLINENGNIETSIGQKSILGLYRLLKEVLEND